MRARLPALAIPFGVCALAIVALVLSIVAAPNDGSCDNIAGTCLRGSQDLLITAIEVGASSSPLSPLVASRSGHRATRAHAPRGRFSRSVRLAERPLTGEPNETHA